MVEWSASQTSNPEVLGPRVVGAPDKQSRVPEFASGQCVGLAIQSSWVREWSARRTSNLEFLSSRAVSASDKQSRVPEFASGQCVGLAIQRSWVRVPL